MKTPGSSCRTEGHRLSERDDVRAFVAIELPDNVKRVLGGVIDGLRQRSRTPVKWVSATCLVSDPLMFFVVRKISILLLSVSMYCLI